MPKVGVARPANDVQCPSIPEDAENGHVFAGVGTCSKFEEQLHTLLSSEIELLENKLLVMFRAASTDSTPTALAQVQPRVSAQPASKEEEGPEAVVEIRTSEFRVGRLATASCDLASFSKHISYDPHGFDPCLNQDQGDQDHEETVEGSGTVEGNAATPLQLVTVREDWVPDRTQTRHFDNTAEPLSGGDVSHVLGLEEDRVVANMMEQSGWLQQVRARRSLGGSSAALHELLKIGHALSEDGTRVPFCRFDFPLNPHSRGRFMWDLCGLIFVAFDIVMIPLVQMVLRKPSSHVTSLYLIANIFWTLDIAVSFVSATVTDKGALETSFVEIAQQYSRSWLFLDIVMVLPEWIWLALDRSKGGFALLRVLKTFRALRLIRMVKMQSILQRQLKRVNSEILYHAMHLLQLVFAFVILNHFIACTWYYITHRTGSGWLEQEVLIESTDADIAEAYLLAYHWSITQFHGSMDVYPGNKLERLFAVVVLLVGMLTFSVFVSLLTNIIFQIRQAQAKKNEQQARLRSYFTRHTVSSQLMLSVKSHLQLQREMGNDYQDDEELLQVLPEQLKRSLLLEVRQVSVDSHWLFAWMMNQHYNAFRDICYAAFVTTPSIKGHPVFECLNACIQMYFVESGLLRYISMRNDRTVQQQSLWRVSLGHHNRLVSRLGRSKVGIELRRGRWICEPALWVKAWQTRGQLITISNSVLLSLEGGRFAKVTNNYPALHMDVAVYARWALRKLKECTSDNELDMWSPAD